MKVGTYSDVLPWGGREQWKPGDVALFEYHCHEGLDSADARLWLRSHQSVTVVEEQDEHGSRESCPTIAERSEEGMSVAYKVRFPDGAEGTVWEDELLTGTEHFCRPGPPLVHELAKGTLTHTSGERHTDRYGAVWLIAPDESGGTAPVEPDMGAYAGRVGALIAEVTRVESRAPEKADLGDVIELGSGVLFSELAWRQDGASATAVGVRPEHGRETHWMDPMAVYRVTHQQVRLYFLPANN